MKRPRAAVLIIDRPKGQILLMRRRRAGFMYSTLPGGKIEEGETPAAAAVREAREETGLEIELAGEVCAFENLERMEHYFLARRFSGQLALGGPEKEKQSEANAYEPQWIGLERLEEVNLLPVRIRAACLNCALDPACANGENVL